VVTGGQWETGEEKQTALLVVVLAVVVVSFSALVA
jgi:hypothetical protein